MRRLLGMCEVYGFARWEAQGVRVNPCSRPVQPNNQQSESIIRVVTHLSPGPYCMIDLL